jgi:hypothetical protein
MTSKEWKRIFLFNLNSFRRSNNNNSNNHKMKRKKEKGGVDIKVKQAMKAAIVTEAETKTVLDKGI